MDFFSVQRVSGDGMLVSPDCTTVQARCAVKAGEVVLSEPLCLHGQIVRARVWTLKDDFTPHAIDLYAAQSAQPA